MANNQLSSLVFKVSTDLAELNSGTKQINNKLEGVGQTANKIGTMIAAAFTAGAILKFAETVKKSSQSFGDSWDQAVGGMTAATDVFFQTIGEGDWSNFLDNFSAAILAGQEYVKILDDIGDRQRSLNILDAEERTQLLELQRIQRDELTSNEERIKAGEKIEEITKRAGERRVRLAKDALKAELDLAAATTGLDQTFIEKYLRLQDDGAFREAISNAQRIIQLQKEIELANVTPNFNAPTATNYTAQSVAQAKAQLAEFSQAQLSFAEKIRKTNLLNDEERQRLADAFVKVKNEENNIEQALLSVRTRNSRLAEETVKKTISGLQTSNVSASTFNNELSKTVELLKKANLSSGDALTSLLGIGDNDQGKSQQRARSLQEQADAMLAFIETNNRALENEKDPAGGVSTIESRALAITALADATFYLDSALAGGEKTWAEYVSAVFSYVGQLLPQLNALIATQTVAAESSKGLIGVATAATALASFFALIGSFSKKATGGFSSGLTLVGERGAELVNMGSGGRVSSNFETKRLLGGGGGERLVTEISGDQLRIILARNKVLMDYL